MAKRHVAVVPVETRIEHDGRTLGGQPLRSLGGHREIVPEPYASFGIQEIPGREADRHAADPRDQGEMAIRLGRDPLDPGRGPIDHPDCVVAQAEADVIPEREAETIAAAGRIDGRNPVLGSAQPARCAPAHPDLGVERAHHRVGLGDEQVRCSRSTLLLTHPGADRGLNGCPRPGLLLDEIVSAEDAHSIWNTCLRHRGHRFTA